MHACSNVLTSVLAGISAESGIATYRDAGGSGIWEKNDPYAVGCLSTFRENAGDVWDMQRQLLKMVQASEPNQGHTAIAEFEQRPEHNVTVVTQNVDSMHTVCQRMTGRQKLLVRLGRNWCSLRVCLGLGSWQPKCDRGSWEQESWGHMHRTGLRAGGRMERSGFGLASERRGAHVQRLWRCCALGFCFVVSVINVCWIRYVEVQRYLF